MTWPAFGASEEGTALKSWVLHMGSWGCAVGIFGIVWGLVKWRSPKLDPSPPGKAALGRLRQAETPDEQHVFAASCPGRRPVSVGLMRS